MYQNIKLTILSFVTVGMTLLTGCSTPKVSYKTAYRQIDSIAIRDSVIFIEIPKERIVDVVSVYDTLRLETSVASATSWVDTTTHTLKGDIENKDVTIPTTIKYVERYHVRDSITTVEVPVEVAKEVTRIPNSYWWMLVGYCIAFILLALKFISKIKS